MFKFLLAAARSLFRQVFVHIDVSFDQHSHLTPGIHVFHGCRSCLHIKNLLEQQHFKKSRTISVVSKITV